MVSKKALCNSGTEPMEIRNKPMLFLFFLLFTSLQAQTTWVQDISISSKKNGVFIKVRSNNALHPTQVAGWFNESSSWYYMTLHKADGDTAQLDKTKLFYPVIQIECIRAGESLQLGFRMAIPVEQFELYYAENPPELLASLRFPLSDVLTSIEQERPPLSPDQKPQSIQQTLWIKAIYFIGAGLTGAGFLAGDTQKGWEVPIGMGLIVTAYVYENFLSEKKR